MICWRKKGRYVWSWSAACSDASPAWGALGGGAGQDQVNRGCHHQQVWEWGGEWKYSWGCLSAAGVHFCQFKVAHKRRVSVLPKAFPYETELQTHSYVKMSVYTISWSLFLPTYKLLLCPYTKHRSTNSAEAVHHPTSRLARCSFCTVGKPLVLEVGYSPAFVTLLQGPIHPLWPLGSLELFSKEY